MKSCPVCDMDYPDQRTTCPTDGAVLIESRELGAGSQVRGKYRIVRKLGQGGMGVVYLADDILLGVRVALKFLSGDLGKDPKFIKRFRTEARTAYQLRHPNIVEVTNLDQAEDGSLFIAMEFVDGPSLHAEIEKSQGGLVIPRALEIARGVAFGLAAAHARGTVHRDIKPENILLAITADGRERPKILDFGIAAIAESVTGMSLTRGLLLTPDYAAPEQWMEMPAAEMDGRTDLYALGCVLYEMLSGRTPFHAHNTAGWMKQHLDEAPKPPSHLRPELADWQGLDALVLRLLAKDRDDRPSSAEETLAELERIGQERFARRSKARRETEAETRMEEAAKFGSRLKEKSNQGARPSGAPAKAVQFEKKTVLKGRARISAFFRRKWPRRAVISMGVLFVLYLILGITAKISFFCWAIYLVVAAISLVIVPVWVWFGFRRWWLRGIAGLLGLGAALLFIVDCGPPILYLRATAGDSGAQVRVADHYRGWIDFQFATDHLRAAALYEKACDGGVLLACARAGDAYSSAEGVQRDLGKAEALYGKACGADGQGNSLGCHGFFELGDIYRDGRVVSKDYDKAEALFSKACDGSKRIGGSDECGGLDGLGEAYSKGDGVKKDESKAVVLYQHACDGGYSWGCEHFGYAYEQGTVLQHDTSKAAVFFGKACDGGDSSGCNLLGDLYWRGDGVPEDRVKGGALLQKACTDGAKWACDELKGSQNTQ